MTADALVPDGVADLSDLSTAELDAVLPRPPKVRRPLRLAELFLLLLALAAGIGAFALIGLNRTGELPTEFWLEAASLAGLALLLHIMVRIFTPWADQTILPAVVLLNGIGLAMILRLQATGTRGADAIRQTQWTALSIVLACLVLAFLRDHRILRRFSYTAMIAGLVLLLLPMVPGIGATINGARIWVRVGGFSFQPGEFAKLAFAVFFAGYLVTHRENLALAGRKVLGLQLPRWRDFGPILVVWGASIATLVLQTDLGMSLMLFAMFVAMLYIATDRVSWIIIGMLMFAAGGYLAVQLFSHVGRRIDVWLHAMNQDVYERVGGSGQLVSGLFGLANGGLFGAGWARGHPNLVPLSFSDMIYTSLGEELGLTGVLAILIVFLIIVERALRTAVQIRDGFGKLLAGGLAFLLTIQLFTVVGGITRLIPMTGLTVPFMAQGGSSLVANWILIALLLRMSDAARRPSWDPGLGAVAQPRPKADVVVPGRNSLTGELPVVTDLPEVTEIDSGTVSTGESTVIIDLGETS